MDSENIYLFGTNPVLEKLKARPGDILEVLIAQGRERPILRRIDSEARRAGLGVTYVEPKVLDRLINGQNHQGVIARVKAYHLLQFADLIQRLSSPPAPAYVLILDGLNDPRNFGALLRTAEAVGVKDILIPKDRSVGVTSTVIKASSGAAHHLNVYKVANLRRSMVTLKEQGFWTVGLDAHAPTTIYDQVYPERLGIVLGSEGKGVRPLITRECDFLVSIPMLGKINSLNVAVAGAVFLYELLRIKRNVDKGRV